MVRTPDGAQGRYTTVTFRCTEREAQMLDAQRGTQSKSDYLRTLIRTAPKRGTK